MKLRQACKIINRLLTGAGNYKPKTIQRCFSRVHWEFIEWTEITFDGGTIPEETWRFFFERLDQASKDSLYGQTNE